MAALGCARFCSVAISELRKAPMKVIEAAGDEAVAEESKGPAFFLPNPSTGALSQRKYCQKPRLYWSLLVQFQFLLPFSSKGRREKTDRIIISFRRMRLADGESRLVRPGTRGRAHGYLRRVAGYARISRLTSRLSNASRCRRGSTSPSLWPKELTLHYIFDDGPKKTVHSYDRLAIDLDVGTVRFSGLKAADVTLATVVGSKNDEWRAGSDRPNAARKRKV